MAQSALDALRERMGIISGLNHAGAVLTWDQECYMPPGSVGSRARALGAVGRVAHGLSTSAEYGRLLEAAEAEVANGGLDPDGDEARLVWRARKDYDLDVKLPPEFVAELRQAETIGTQVWQEARKADDYARFAPQLDTLVGLQRRLADYLGYDDHPYDALLDLFEPEMKTADVRRVFADLRERTVPLVRAIAANRDAVDDAVLYQHFDPDRQWALGRELTELFGYDYEHGRMDRSAHPFTTSFGPDDVRLTARVDAQYFGTCFFSAAHEGGHALHGQGVPERFAGTPLAGGASSGIGESQSRLWENIIGRGREFWRHFYPRVREVFPQQFGDVDLEGFYRAVNRSQPSLIRVEADEVTYNLHIMLRFDLELALLEGQLGVADLPRRWNEKMEEYLGIVPPSDADGVLQDVHWGSGLFGYFPTYTLGNVMSVQLYKAARAAHPDLSEQLARGEFGTVLAWMREHVHACGRKYLPQEVLERATGRRLTAEPYVAYLTAKFGDLYGLKVES
jgi:carboxypeptidase Taq